MDPLESSDINTFLLNTNFFPSQTAHLSIGSVHLTMAPSWVKTLIPSVPQGTELLAQERAQSNVPVDKLSEFLFTKEVLARQDQILNILKADKVFDKSQNYFNGREERFQTALARAKRMRQLAVKHEWSHDEYVMANDLISEPGPYALHATMFLVCQLFCEHLHAQNS